MTLAGSKVRPLPGDAQRAHRTRLGWIMACCNFEIAARHFESVRRKYSPDQPQVPAGNPDGGQWTAGGGQSRISVRTLNDRAASADIPGQILSDETPDPILLGQQFAQARTTVTTSHDAMMPKGGEDTLVTRILRRAKNLNLTASPADYQKCLNICYPILERPRPPWSDRNKYDFHRCMSACLGINR